jgi:DNA invertase Pin-like site-specific DNA recombinase
VVDVFEDVDRSAYKARVRREGYERLLDAVRDGRLDGVLVWKLDRLVRRPLEFERFWAVCEQHKAVLASATEPIDTSTDLGLALVRILVAFAGLESATMATRQREAHRELAMRGQPHRGGGLAFGLNRDWTALVEPQAALLREAARRVIAGEKLAAITDEWNRRGERALKGGPWNPWPADAPRLGSCCRRPDLPGQGGRRRLLPRHLGP